MLRAINDSPDEPMTYGADSAEASDDWFTALSNAAGPAFCEGMVILDYGCGCGRYANWISKHIREFTYYGLEPERATPKWHNELRMIETNLHIAERNYRDPRVRFAAIGSETEAEALSLCTLINAGSVFTHLLIDEYAAVIRKFAQAIKRGVPFVHSLFIGPMPEVSAGTSNCHGVRGCYHWSIYTRGQIEKSNEGLNVRKVGELGLPSDYRRGKRVQMLMVTSNGGMSL